MKQKKPKLTLAALIAWLRKKKPDEPYVYISNCGCVIAQFVRSQGFENVCVTPGAVAINGRLIPLPTPLNKVAVEGKSTFGAALKRARKLAV